MKNDKCEDCNGEGKRNNGACGDEECCGPNEDYECSSCDGTGYVVDQLEPL